MVGQVKPLHIALIVKNTPAAFEREQRNMGIFSYAVPEFTWEHFAPGKGATLDLADFQAQGFDLVWLEDGGVWCDFTRRVLPVCYYAIDSTLSDEHHYQPRLEQARKADLVLVDHDDLRRFAGGAPVHRLSHCVNDRLFQPVPKSIEVCFHCGSSPERHEWRVRLSKLCASKGWRYVSGAVSLSDYARDMGQAKVVVNVPRTPTNRPHRVFDAMSSGAALVTLPLPAVSGELRRSGVQYLECGAAELEDRIESLLEHGTWELLAMAGREFVLAKHTWAVRAKELRELIQCALSV